ncbi:protein kinase domain-containing protein [Nannocystaceae bacterium ST9]
MNAYEETKSPEGPGRALAEAVGWARFGRLRGWPTLPVRLGRYELRRTLGHGGMGHVFAAWDPELARDVALKVLDQADAGAIAAARHEARCLARLHHPNVVRVHEVGEARLEGLDPPDTRPRAYVAMELIERSGQGLGPVSRQGLRTWEETLEILLAAGRGLSAVHDAGMVHGDFKTGNVLIGDDGVVRVIDFGLASGPTHEVASHEAPSELGPMFVQRAGTVPFMAPERLEGGPADALGDQWSFCVTAWELLFGVLPFGARATPDAILAAIASGRIARGRRERGLPRTIEAVLRRGLAEDPAARYPAMSDLLAALERAAERPARWRSRLGRGSLALALVASLAGLGVLGRERERCTAELEALDRQWDPVARTRLFVGFMASDRPAPRADFDWVAARLDGWTSQWRDAWSSACTTRQCGAEAACLVRQRDEFAALLELLLAPSEELHRAARGLVAQLDPPGCGSVRGEVDEAIELAAGERRLALALEAGARTRASDELAALERSVERMPAGPAHERSALIVERWRARLALEQGELELARELLRDALGRAALAGPALEDVRLALLFERLRLHARSDAPTLEAIRDDGLAALTLVERSGSATLHLAWAQAYAQALGRVDVHAALAVLEPSLDRLTATGQGSPRLRLEMLIGVAELLDRAGQHERAGQRWSAALPLAESLYGAQAVELVPVLRGLLRNAFARDERSEHDLSGRLDRLLRLDTDDPSTLWQLAHEYGVPID